MVHHRRFSVSFEFWGDKGTTIKEPRERLKHEPNNYPNGHSDRTCLGKLFQGYECGWN